MNVKPLLCKRPRTKERRDKQREKAVTWSPLALVDCRKRHPKGGFPLLLQITRENKIEAMHERLRLNVRVERLNFNV